MAIELSTEETRVLDKAIEYGMKNFAPNVQRWETEGRFPLEAFRQTAADGFVGLLVAPESGGKGYRFLEAALTYQGLARSSAAMTLAISTDSNIIYGLSQLSKAPGIHGLLPSMINGSAILTYAFTEDGAGSDPGSAVTVATPVAGGFRINGRKSWATLGSEARYIQLTAKLGDSSRRDMINLLVDTGSPGLAIGENYNKTGANLLSTVDLVFDDCFVPDERLVTPDGYRAAMWGIGLARIFVGAIAIGLCEAAIDTTARFLADRKQFNRPLLDNQGLRWKLAEFMARVEAGKWLVYRAASLMDKEGKAPLEGAMAKYYCANLAVEVTDLCTHFFGARGFRTGTPLELMAREARMLRIIDGTSEIQLEVMGKWIDGKYRNASVSA
jgi:alkylation response protein AidB-like acyl-CoA dehydrogenase